MLTLQYGNYIFSLTPEIEISTNFTSNESEARKSEVQTWVLKGFIHGESAAQLASDIADFTDAFSTDKQTLELKDDAASLLLLDSADFWESPKIIRSKIHANDDSGNPYVDYVKFEIVVEARKLEGSGTVLSHNSTIKITEDKRKKFTITAQGEFKAKEGFQASNLLDSVLLTVASGFRRIEKTFETDADDKILKYKTVDETVFEQLPQGVYDGYLLETEEFNSDGHTILLRGVFYGPQAMQQAQNLKPASGLLGMKITENPQEQKVEFEFQQLVAETSQGLLRKQQKIAYQTKLSFKDFKILASNAQDFRQILGSPDYIVTQEGFAVSNNSYPSPANPCFSADVIERKITYEFPEGFGVQKIFKTTWFYVMKPLNSLLEQGIT